MTTTVGAFQITETITVPATLLQSSSETTSSSTSSATTTLTSSQSPASSAIGALKILSNTSYVDSVGITHVAGELQNTGTENIIFAEVTVTFYNSQGKVIDTDFSYSMLDDLSPGQKAHQDPERIPSSRVIHLLERGGSLQENIFPYRSLFSRDHG